MREKEEKCERKNIADTKVSEEVEEEGVRAELLLQALKKSTVAPGSPKEPHPGRFLHCDL